MTRRTPFVYVLVLLVAALTGCGAGASGVRQVPATSTAAQRVDPFRGNPASKLKHIVIVIQENRSVDNLFNGFCASTSKCANTVTVDPVSGTQLVQESMAAPYSPLHEHSQYVLEYDGGKMDGFVNAKSTCAKGIKPCNYSVLAYVPSSETTVYQQLATLDGELSDETFQTNQGPSFPAHYYAIAGQSGGYDPDHLALISGSGNCGTQSAVSNELDMTTPYPGQIVGKHKPCEDFQTIFDALEKKGRSWRFYSNGEGFWTPTQAIQHLYNSSNYIEPSHQFITDVGNGTLADVTFVDPDSPSVSDHPVMVKDPKAGPNWVASVVNAVGQSSFWDSTAVVIWWDDWGGFFDHVKPPAPSGEPSWMGVPDPFEYGFRVPLIVVSPYAHLHLVDHKKRTFVGALRLIEKTFGLASLGTADQYEPDALDSMFNFNQTPFAYTPVGPASTRPFRRTR